MGFLREWGVFLALARDEEGGGQQDEAADDEPLPGAGNADHDEHAVQHDDQQHAEKGAEHRAGAAGDARAAEHDGGDDVDLGADEVEGIGLPVGADMDDAGKARERPRIAEQEDMHGAQAVAEAACNIGIAADGEDGAAHQGAVEDPPGHEGRDGQDEEIEGQRDQRAVGGFELDERHAAEGAHLRRQRHDPDRADEGEQETAEEILRADGDDQRRHLEVMDEQAVDDAERRPAERRHEDDDDDGQARQVALHQHRHRIHGEGRDRREGHVDAARRQDDEDAEREEPHDHAGATDVDEGRGLQEGRVGDGDRHADRHQEKKGDGLRAAANEFTEAEGTRRAGGAVEFIDP